MGLHYLLKLITEHPIIAVEGGAVISFWWFFWEPLLTIQHSFKTCHEESYPQPLNLFAQGHFVFWRQGLISCEDESVLDVRQGEGHQKQIKLIIIGDSWPRMVDSSAHQIRHPSSFWWHVVCTVQTPCCSCAGGGPSFSGTGTSLLSTSSPCAWSLVTSSLLSKTCLGWMITISDVINFFNLLWTIGCHS